MSQEGNGAGAGASHTRRDSEGRDGVLSMTLRQHTPRQPTGTALPLGAARASRGASRTGLQLQALLQVGGVRTTGRRPCRVPSADLLRVHAQPPSRAQHGATLTAVHHSNDCILTLRRTQQPGHHESHFPDGETDSEKHNDWVKTDRQGHGRSQLTVRP